MNRRRRFLMAFAVMAFTSGSAHLISGQDDKIGGNWSNPAGASMGSMINDQLASRMRAKAQQKAGGANPASKKTPAQIEAAVHFRSTGTPLRAQAFADFLSAG